MARPKPTVIEHRTYYLPMHFPVLLLSGDYWKISDIPSERLHFHNCLEIGLCHSESGTLEICGKKHYYKAGDITIIPKNVPHTTYSSLGMESHWSYLFLEPKVLFHNILPAAWENIDLNINGFRGYQHIVNKDTYPYIHFLMTNIIRELETKPPCYHISVRGLLLSLYIEIYRLQAMANTNSSNKQEDSDTPANNALVIAPALDYIEENYMNSFTIDQLADLCHWSPTHFRRIFYSIMGVLPLDYVNTTRIMKSCDLLQSTELSILEISEMVGFHTLSSYNRHFTKLIQMSPRAYRNHMKQMDKRAEKQIILEYTGWLYPE